MVVTLRVICNVDFPGTNGSLQPVSGAAGQPRPISIWQVGEQPSFGSVLPSSHSSVQLPCTTPSPQVCESPEHTPATHSSAMVQVIPSLHDVPSGSGESAGQSAWLPVQLSATSH